VFYGGVNNDGSAISWLPVKGPVGVFSLEFKEEIFATCGCHLSDEPNVTTIEVNTFEEAE
jgi:hypothetical protein